MCPNEVCEHKPDIQSVLEEHISYNSPGVHLQDPLTQYWQLVGHVVFESQEIGCWEGPVPHDEVWQKYAGGADIFPFCWEGEGNVSISGVDSWI